ncbi:CHAT domain-containing protein [Pyxidicoccus sp. MSG2]|uniref:CHAT domain-containing protein n=1 Tax=Pyxidicoccus sp. MSG2 TaxID=2996790 RepID=UPI00226DC519|nr:CHAT domain-containing protein [Pyxidicoccus sp. MSG2]MCY1018624.1 CHAT domain-containing protein [Pyxidicoccus sp. MSG2]
MSTLCDNIVPFVDGELSPPAAEAFRDHLPDCPRCQAQLSNLLVLERLGARYMAHQGERKSSRELPLPQPRSPGRPPRWHLVSWAAAGCALILALVLGSRGARHDDTSATKVAWNLPGRTRNTPRISDPRADAHRPTSGQLMDGTARREELPNKELGRLKELGDRLGQAAMYLAWHRPQETLDILDTLSEQGPDAQSLRAAALLELGRPEEALRVLDPLLTAHPGHLQARWNRALVLEALRLPLLAARDFQEVAQAREEGWSQEAAERAEELYSRSSDEETRWRTTLDDGKALVATGHLAEGSPLASSPLLRLFFYEAVRTRTSSEDVRALLPLAKTLDAGTGDKVLQRHVERIALRDFARRAPLVREYVALLPDFARNPLTPAFLPRLLHSGEDDLVLGALIRADAVFQHLDTFEALARVSQDPWFELLALQKRADDHLRSGDLWSAQAKLERAQQLCERTSITYRCMELELDLAHLQSQFLQPDEVQRHAMAGWKLSQEHNLRDRQLQFLEMLAKAARLRDDAVVARAYLHESLERSRGDKRQEHYIQQELAHLELHVLDFDRAREAIDRALATGRPLTLHGASALSDIARQRPDPKDEKTLSEAVAAEGPMPPGRHALALHALGRFHVEKDRALGRAQLRDAIRESDAAGPQDEDARHARTYAYTALILDEAKAHDFEAALRLFGEELRGDVPVRCVLALTVDSERSLVVARGADRVTRGYYEGNRKQRVKKDAPDLVPPEALAALQPCEKVDVLARPPLQGLSGLLLPDFAWSYRRQLSARQAPQGRRIHLVVKNVEYDSGRKLPALFWNATFGNGEEPRLLEGARATPDRVLREMEDATEIDLVTHGLLSPVSDASFLVLARENAAADSDELRARQLRRVKLKGAPLVVIAACHGGHSAPVLHEPLSLPSVLIEAGARGVFAATIRIPDKGASDFFNAIRARLRDGETPAVALRNERLAWRQRSPTETWVDSILLFE